MKMDDDYELKISKYQDDYPEEDYYPSNARMLRGPGQKASDPFQFVAAKGGEELAETAKSTLHVAQQQKEQRDKILQGQRQTPKFEDSEPWQADLDTWRRKRKEKIVEKVVGGEKSGQGKNPDEYTSYWPSGKVKDEVLQINSSSLHQRDQYLPRHHSNSTSSPALRSSSSDDLNNDSGIDNRTVETPSTSEFSPRSTDLFSSPKSFGTSAADDDDEVESEEQPPKHPPPPPPQFASSSTLDQRKSADEKLDQVLIPLKFTKTQSSADASVVTSSFHDKKSSSAINKEDRSFTDSSRHLERNAYMPSISSNLSSTARVEATFKQPPPWEGVKPFVSRAAQQQKQPSADEHIDLSVELNREQKATITATKYPRGGSIEQPTKMMGGVAAASSPASLPPPPPPPPPSTIKTIYRTVDIPLDEPQHQPMMKRERMFTLNITMGSQPVHKGFGFTTTTSKIDANRLIVESVIVGSPADKAGLLVGDTIVSINGEEMKDKYQSGINRILYEAARVGEADIMILRAPASVAPISSKQSTSSSSLISNSSYDRARSVFTENKSFDSYADFKRKHSRTSNGSTTTTSSSSAREYNSLPRGTSGGTTSSVRRRDASLNKRDGDYRVTSYHTRNEPGKLTDFVPEADRAAGDAPKTIRNFRLSTENVATTRVNFDAQREAEEEAAVATLKRTTLPRKSTATWKNEYRAEGNENENVQLNSMSNLRPTTPLRSALKNHTHNYYYRGDDDDDGDDNHYGTLPPAPPRQSRRRQHFNDESEDEEEEVEEEEIIVEERRRRHQHRQQQHQQVFHTVGSYGVPPRSDHQPRSRSVGNDQRFDENDDRSISRVSHRFYDRDGNVINDSRSRSRQRDGSVDIAIRREYSRERINGGGGGGGGDGFYQQSYQEETRDWRDVINMQRQPAPGFHSDRRGIAATSASLSNLPSFINRRMEKQQQQQRENQQNQYFSYQQPGVEKYERDEWSRVEQRNYQSPAPAPMPVPVPVAASTPAPAPAPRTTKDDTVVAVSGKHRCAHCNEELGRGAAMIVESLNLFYHLACFKCYVCKTSLGSGATGADVRVRDGRLHCQTCYSNERVQLSKV